MSRNCLIWNKTVNDPSPQWSTAIEVVSCLWLHTRNERRIPILLFLRKISPTPSLLSCIQAKIHSRKGNLSSPFRCDAIFPPILFSLNSPSAAIKVCLIGLIVPGLPGYICQAKLCGPPLGPAQLLSNFEGREIDGMKHRWSGQLDGSENETHYRHL